MHPFRTAVESRDFEGAVALLADFTVMVRPLSGALALAEAMKAQLEAGPD
jgi:hypothetical protein